MHKKVNPKLINTPFVIITIATLLGVLLGYYTFIEVNIAIISFLISICGLAIFWQQSKKMFSKTTPFVILTILVFINFGIVLVKIHNLQNYSNHYSNEINSKEIGKTPIGIEFCITERLKSTAYYDKYIVSIRLIKNKATHGKILLRISKKSSINILDIGNIYLSYATLKPITKPLNPNQFDYARYLRNQYILHQITIQPNQLIYNEKKEWSVYFLADQIRKKINENLSKYHFKSKEFSVINALYLGQRQDMSQEIFKDYRDAGAIHILAVSGLHIGILLFIIKLMLMPLNRIKKYGRKTKLILSITLLWSFAIIAGLSPSVLRAVTMFSFLAIGMEIRSKTSTYNSLFISLFLLVCSNPLLIFSVSFQLSYVAVFSILWIQPIIVNKYKPRFYVTKILWTIFTVTIAAQLGLLPLSLFYFHQFPLLFFVSNLIILPFLGIILGFGVFVILLALLNILPQFIANLFGNCIDSMNTTIGWIAQQEIFIIKNISFSWSMLIASYLVIISFILVCKQYKRMKLYFMVSSIILIISIITYEKYRASRIEELILFHNQQNTTLGIVENQKIQLYSKDSISMRTTTFLLKNYLIKNQITLIDSTIKLKNVYLYKKQTILILDSSDIYKKLNLQPDVLILSNSPKIHLKRVINTLKPKQIVADGSNYRSYLDRWEKSCTILKVPFYRTDKEGAFIIKQ
ncbi:ComEC/Rec2 family competence protein [Aquimarina muelleri]|uniref:Competence protein ComEC n=1 Tax=Aquimarina muelleri TaxID=279356 RepID=A0A918JUL1_9FLAO|nr:ComEC/Rec2 family competence protein [Aquimarina muelleri]MCX2761358.1 ComEC family competence protein [Aquimarina muelleri]GGX13053.1 competence protein ComEC [Aquimarina muelleri]